MSHLERELIDELEKKRDRKLPFTFTLPQSTKRALTEWCRDNGHKESRVLDTMIRKFIPKKYFSK